MKYLFFIVGFIVSGCNPVPTWTSSPYEDALTLCGVGSAKEGSLSTRKKVAYLQAKADLSRMVQTEITTRYQKVEQCSDKGCEQAQISRSLHTSKQLLKTAWIKASYNDDTRGIYYTMVCITR